MKIDKPYDVNKFIHDFFMTDDEEALSAFASYCHIVELEKGDLVFGPGATEDSTTFLLDGVLKSFIKSPDGTENTFTFWFEPGTCIGVTKDMINIPEVYCVALTPCTLIKMVGSSPYELAKEYPVFWKETMIATLPFALRIMAKARAGYVLDARERYLWFLDKYGPIADIVPLSEVALFLGIKPQSLSRIRAELIREGALPVSPKDEKSFPVKP